MTKHLISLSDNYGKQVQKIGVIEKNLRERFDYDIKLQDYITGVKADVWLETESKILVVQSFTVTGNVDVYGFDLRVKSSALVKINK